MKIRFYIFIFFLLSLSIRAQFPGAGNKDMMKAMSDIKGRVYGKIIDATTKKPVEFAAVAVLWFNKDSIIGGSIAKANGEFNIEGLPPVGGFRFRATQIGYKKVETKFYLQMPTKLEVDLGDLKMELDETLLKEVDVVAEKKVIDMSIDRRAYNVDKDISVRGGSAVDVMKNVPGVTVDADGNAQLRNQSPTIYIDGRPTTMTLPQIPADQIDRVEVITNPSVKFDASATGGILNIVMKKNLKPGYNGMLMAYAGTGDRYGGMGNFNLKEGKWNYSVMYTYNQAINLTKGYTYRQQFDSAGQTTGFFNQNNQTNFRSIFNFAKLGIDYMINNRNTLTLSSMLMGGDFKTIDDQNFEVLDANKNKVFYGDRENLQHGGFQNYNGQILHKKTWPKSGKELTTDVSFNKTYAANNYLFTTHNHLDPDTFYLPNQYQKNQGGSGADQYNFQMDYVDPLTETSKLEWGFKSTGKRSEAKNTTQTAVATEDVYTRDSVMSNDYKIDDMVNAAYINYNGRLSKTVYYQSGLRFEGSYYKGTIADKKQTFSYNYPSSTNDLMNSIFPGIYLSKKLNGGDEWQLNFSRKIQRPNFFQLMPIVMFADKQNYRIGNPQLKPEFRNISELNYNNIFKNGNYLGSAYFRYEEQPITDIAYPQLNNPNVLVNTTVNGDNSIKYGMEHTIKYTFFKNLDVMVNANVFYIYLKGLIVPTEPVVTATGYAFNIKSTISYKFPKSLTLQVNGGYESPKVLLLGASNQIYGFDVSLNKMIGIKWIFNLTLSDVMNTRAMGAHYQTPYYTQDLSRRRESRFVKLSISYIFGKMDASIFKKAKQMRNMDNNQGNQDGLDFGK
jgi:hypothetical protein